MVDEDEVSVIEARIAAAGYIVCCDDCPPPGVAEQWLAACVPTEDAAPARVDHAATGATQLEALRALERLVFG